MNMEKLEQDIEAIISALVNYESETITGQLLGSSLIPKAAPHLDIREVVDKPSGPGALSLFVREYLSKYLLPHGKKGMDILYRIYHDGLAPKVKNNHSPAIWKTFTSLSEKFELYLDVSEAKLLACSVDSGRAISNDLIKIKSVTQDEFDYMRSDFVLEMLKDSDLDELKDMLNNALNYSNWTSILRKNALHKYNLWSSYRQQKIIEIFEIRLKALDIEKDMIEKLVIDLTTSQREKIARKALSNNENRAKKVKYDSSLKDEYLRKVLFEAISQMPVQDLRQLNLPFGIVFDVISNKKSK